MASWIDDFAGTTDASIWDRNPTGEVTTWTEATSAGATLDHAIALAPYAQQFGRWTCDFGMTAYGGTPAFANIWFQAGATVTDNVLQDGFSLSVNTNADETLHVTLFRVTGGSSVAIISEVSTGLLASTISVDVVDNGDGTEDITLRGDGISESTVTETIKAGTNSYLFFSGVTSDLTVDNYFVGDSTFFNLGRGNATASGRGFDVSQHLCMSVGIEVPTSSEGVPIINSPVDLGRANAVATGRGFDVTLFNPGTDIDLGRGNAIATGRGFDVTLFDPGIDIDLGRGNAVATGRGFDVLLDIDLGRGNASATGRGFDVSIFDPTTDVELGRANATATGRGFDVTLLDPIITVDLGRANALATGRGFFAVLRDPNAVTSNQLFRHIIERPTN